ncbi:MAG: FAD-dependent oxidoreductase [Bacteroidaceae bacterium]|nr:FAD-dependent oxidoreductase [Bacteroidaceae bacterium]
MKKAAIIGAGISGLSTAHLLKDRYDCTIFEKEETPGGLIRCRRVNGSLFHICGGHIFNSKRQDVLDWFWSIFNREEEFQKADRNSVVFMADGKHIPYPIENHIYLFDNETQKLFIQDLLSIAKNEGYEPHNFEEFLRNRFGETLYNIYFKPYNEKVWRRNLKSVPLSWLEGKLPMPTVEEMIFNNINQVKEKNFVHATFWYEKENGSQHIADKLSQGLNIKYNSNIESIERRGNKWIINEEDFDTVVFCGNIKQLPTLLKGVEITEYKEKIDALEYHGTTAVFCQIEKNNYSWIYLPDNKYESHRIICTGNFAASNNAPDTMTATVEFTDEISKDDIMEQLGRIPMNPKYIDHQYNKYTYPIQDADTRNMIASLKSELAKEDFFFTGRFADWEYYNMDVAIGAAMDLCKTL